MKKALLIALATGAAASLAGALALRWWLNGLEPAEEGTEPADD